MNKLWQLGLVISFALVMPANAGNYQRASRSGGSYRGWYVRAFDSYRLQKTVNKRIWWGQQWWGLGWSTYPHYWTYGRAANLGLPFMAEEGRWDDIEATLQKSIAYFTQKRALLQKGRSARYGVVIANLTAQIRQLNEYLEDAQEYRNTSVVHSQEEREGWC